VPNNKINIKCWRLETSADKPEGRNEINNQPADNGMLQIGGFS